MDSFSNSALPKGRVQLATVLSAAGDIVHVDDVERILRLPRAEASKRLSRWMGQGWLNRVGRGAYVPASIETLGSDRPHRRVGFGAGAVFSWLCRRSHGGRALGSDGADIQGHCRGDGEDAAADPSSSARRYSRFNMPAREDIRHQVGLATSQPGARLRRSSYDRRHARRARLGGGIQHVADCLTAYLARADRNDTLLIHTPTARQWGGLQTSWVSGRAHRHAARLSQPAFQRLTAECQARCCAHGTAAVVSRWRLRLPVSWRALPQT